jgi:peptide/nickel transport system substrate-binding protein
MWDRCIAVEGKKERRMKQGMVGVLAVVLVVAGIFGGPWDAALAGGETIRIADSKGDWGYPNPYRHYPRGPGYVRMSWVFDTLVWKDRNGYVPMLARKWHYDAERQAFSFELEPGIKWHDGQPLTAKDVAFTVDYFKQHPYRWVTVSFIDRVDIEDDLRFTIVLAKPYAPFLSDIGGTMPILPAHVWSGVEDPKAFDDPKSFIGSGPFVFKDFNKAQGTYLYEAFADYYRGEQMADRLIYVKSGKPLVSLMTGQVDLANIKPEMAEPLKAKGLTVIANERGWNKKLMINHRKFPFDRKVFRQALACAIDRQEIVDKAHRGFATVASYGLLSIDHEIVQSRYTRLSPQSGQGQGADRLAGVRRR